MQPKLVSTLIFLFILIFLSACDGEGLFSFPTAAAQNKLDNCNSQLNGDWAFSKSSPNSPFFGTLQEHKSDGFKRKNLYLRIRVNKDCQNSSVRLGVKGFRLGPKGFRGGAWDTKIKTILSGAPLFFKIDLLEYTSGTYFSVDLRPIDPEFVILKYKLINKNTLQLSMVNSDFVASAIHNKYIPGEIGGRGRGRYVNPLPTSIQLKDFIEQYSSKIFDSTIIFVRKKDQIWKIVKDD